MVNRILAAVFLSTLATAVAAQTSDQQPQAVFERAVADFQAGRIADATTGFDTLIKLVPNSGPQLWQRGIALYYARRYRDCREQFESHRTVNPNDVENAAWHFLCVARAESPAVARKALLPVGPDSRAPMREIYEMFRGTMQPDEVLMAAGNQPGAQFYAHLYLGLYFEALGNQPKTLEHITIAASERYRMGGYMHGVARVHLAILQGRK
jgi:lipoprotein NlpI